MCKGRVVGKSGRKEGEQMFVPVKKRKSAKLTEFEETVKKTLQKATESLENDKVGELLTFFERQNELARQHELNLISMMFGHSSRTNQQLPSNAATSLWQSNQTSRNQVAPQWPNQSTPLNYGIHPLKH